jgi:hypothetical protein
MITEKELEESRLRHIHSTKYMQNLDNYPEHLRLIVKVILEDGESLTDGIEYYADYEDILKFANDIYIITGAGN